MGFGLKRAQAEVLDPRRGERSASGLSTTALLGTGDRVDVVIKNMSTTGFLASIPIALHVGHIFRVGLSNNRLRHARVVRREGDNHGCAFLAPLAEDEIAG